MHNAILILTKVFAFKNQKHWKKINMLLNEIKNRTFKDNNVEQYIKAQNSCNEILPWNWIWITQYSLDTLKKNFLFCLNEMLHFNDYAYL